MCWRMGFVFGLARTTRRRCLGTSSRSLFRCRPKARWGRSSTTSSCLSTGLQRVGWVYPLRNAGSAHRLAHVLWDGAAGCVVCVWWHSWVSLGTRSRSHHRGFHPDVCSLWQPFRCLRRHRLHCFPYRFCRLKNEPCWISLLPASLSRPCFPM
jgi:hypothetical protein